MKKSKIGVLLLLGFLLSIALSNQAKAGFFNAIAKIFKGAETLATTAKGAAKGADDVATGVTKTPEELLSKPVQLADEADESLRLKLIKEEEVPPDVVHSKMEAEPIIKPVEVFEVSVDLVEVIEACVQGCFSEEEP